MEVALHVVHAFIEALQLHCDFLLLIQRLTLTGLLSVMASGRVTSGESLLSMSPGSKLCLCRREGVPVGGISILRLQRIRVV